MKSMLLMFAQMPESVFIGLAILTGLCLGSFYAVCVYRHGAGESIVWPPSHCPACDKKLRPWEMIPLISWLVLRGHCSHCHAPIHWRYPLIEAISGAVGGILAWLYGPGMTFLVYFLFSGLLIVASGIDFSEFLLPDVLTLPAAILALPSAVFLVHIPWKDSLLGGLAGAGVFLAVKIFYKLRHGHEGMGLGDVKLMLSLGFLCGAKLLPFLVITAGITALFYLLAAAKLTGRQIRTLPVPFVPFLCLGFFAAITVGDDAMAWWFHLVTGF